MSALRCSVVIPSYQRQHTLELVLGGLAAQTLPKAEFEVIVVLDGTTDGSADMLARWLASGRLPNLRWHWQSNQGQAVARNTGAELAGSPVLVFLDDDVVPAPDLLAVHVAHHGRNARLAVLGDCRVVREQADSLYHLGVWAWWEDKYHTRALPQRQASYRDFCTGNVSLRREDLLAVGGFDPGFRGYGGEDYELGHRLLQAGVQFVPDRQAQAQHYHRTTVAGVLRATRQEGTADVLLGAKHLELRRGLRLMVIPRDRYGLLIWVAMVLPALGDRLTASLRALLPLYERFKLRRRWQQTFNLVRGYAYWRGVRDALGAWHALRTYQAAAAPAPVLALDLEAGLPQPLPPLWVEGPSDVTLRVRGRPVGRVHLGPHVEQPVPDALTAAIIDQVLPELCAALPDSAQPEGGV